MADLSTTEHLLLIFGSGSFAILITFLAVLCVVSRGWADFIEERWRRFGGWKGKVAAFIVIIDSLLFALFVLTVLFSIITYSVLKFNQIYLSNGAQLIIELSDPYLIPSGIAFAIMLYRLRRNRPALYGMIEFIVACISIWTAVLLVHTDNPSVKILSFMGGVYILVRALDNLSKGVPQRLEPVWGLLFGPSESALQCRVRRQE
jgi:hypothetical protein